MTDIQEKHPTIYSDFASLEQRVLASPGAEALRRACLDESSVKTIAVEYHAPAAPGRRKVGGAQWKTERRGGFSRR